ncbi:MAG: diguanylate cyclase [Nitrospirae bacterium]|nr:MAG: diguanylate cyclase [Nitrospirota bacterium]
MSILDSQRARVMVMSPTASVRRAFQARVQAAGYDVWSGPEGSACDVEAVICHLPGSGMGALALLQDLRDSHSDACLIVAGRDHGAERTAALLRTGAFDYLATPVPDGRLEEALRQGLEVRRSFLQVRELSDKLQQANEELARERDGLRHWNQSLVLVNDLSQSFAGTLDAEEIVQMVGHRLTPMLDLDLLGVGWCAPPRAWVHAAPATDSATIQRVQGVLLAGGSGSVTRTPEGTVAGESAVGGAVLEVPLRVAQEPVGFLRLQRGSREPFEPYHVELIKAVTTSLALALRNAEAHLQVQSQALTDGLTNLLNRRAFTNILAREFREAERYQTPLCLIMLDVDHFKSVNDRFGHPVGDRLLQDVAGLIGQAIRTVDIATRYGGEEFAIILPRTDVAQAQVLANRIRELLAQQTFLADGARFGLTVSMGIAQTPNPQIATVDDLVAAADEALYQAKTRGRNRVETNQSVRNGAAQTMEGPVYKREKVGVGNAGARC